MKVRRLGRLLGVCAFALLLSGCFKVNMDVEVSPENTVSGKAIIAVDESLLELSGQSADQLFKDMDLSSLPAGATTEKYQEDGFIGQQITFSDVPLAEFTGNNTLSGTGTGSGDQLNIVRQGDEFHVTGAFDMSGPEFTGTEVPKQFLENFEFTISITFPGEVKSATGEIDGRTVTWKPTFGKNTRVEAVASAIPSASSPLLMILLIAGAALILGAAVFVITHRKPAPAAASFDDAATMPVDTTLPAPPGSPVEPVTPVEPPPPAAPTTIEPPPDLPAAPDATVPPEDDAPPPPSSV